MDTPRHDARYARSRGAMLKEAFDLARELGVDRVTVAAVVSRAQVSRPTFYAHFGDVEGLMADLWLLHHRDWILLMCDPANRDVYERPESLGLLQLLLSAPRKPELLEAIELSLNKLFDECFSSRSERTVAIWTMSNRLGVLATRTQWPKAKDAAFLDGYLHAVSGKFAAGDVTDYSNLESVRADEDQDSASALINATIGIVQSTGVQGLSVLRLGRVLNATSGFVGPRVESLTTLVGEAFDFALKEATRSNFTLWDGGLKRRGIEGFAAYMVGGLGEPRKNWRWFRREVLLASIHDSELAKSVSSSLDDFLKDVTKKAKFLPVPKIIPERLAVLVHTLLFGLSAVFAVGIEVRDLSHSTIIRAMVAELGKRIVRGAKLV